MNVNKIERSLKIFAKLTLASVLLVAVFSLIWYQFTGLKVHFFHESAFPLLYAETNIDTHSLFSSRFSGREISPISWPLIGSLLLLIKGVDISLITHSVYSVLFVIFVFCVGLVFCKVMKFSFFTSALFLTLVFIVFGPIPSTYLWFDQVWVWPMNSYGVYDFFSLICMTLVVWLLKFNNLNLSSEYKEFKLKYILILVISAIIFFLFSLNGVRGFITISGGVLFAIALDYTIRSSPLNKSNIRPWIIITILTGFSFFGLLLINHLTHGIPQPWQNPHKILTLSNWSEFRDRLISMPYTYLILFNAIPVAGKSIFSIESIISLSNAFFSLAIIFIPLSRLSKLSTEQQPERLMTYRFVFILVMISIAAIYGSSAMTPRYLIPLAYAAIFVFPFYIESWLQGKYYGIIAIFVVLLIPAYITSISSLTKYSWNEYKENKFYKLSQFLKNEGLAYGFGGPWETGIITVNHYSSGKVRIAILDPENNHLKPHRHFYKKWYEPNTHFGSTFIALPESIYKTNKKVISMRKQALKTLKFENWIIDVYPGNISNQLYDEFK